MAVRVAMSVDPKSVRIAGVEYEHMGFWWSCRRLQPEEVTINTVSAFRNWALRPDDGVTDSPTVQFLPTGDKSELASGIPAVRLERIASLGRDRFAAADRRVAAATQILIFAVQGEPSGEAADRSGVV